MSITDELRKYAEELETAASRKSEHGFSPAAMKLTAIADRIDAEHEAQLNDAFETRNSDENAKLRELCETFGMIANDAICDYYERDKMLAQANVDARELGVEL